MKKQLTACVRKVLGFVLAGLMVGLSGSGVAQASVDLGFLARIYAADSNKSQMLFTYKHEVQQVGDVRTIVNTYSDASGVVSAIEKVEFVKEGEIEKVRSYHMSQKQLGAEGDVAVRDGKVIFKYDRDGKSKNGEEKLTDEFVVGPSVTAYLRRHWAKIAVGEKVYARFAVPDRAETVGFEYFKDREETIDGKKVFAIKMKPASFIIAALVKPLYFFMTPDGESLIEVHGRTQVKQNVNGSWKDLDAVTTYEYVQAAAAPTPTPGAVPAKTSKTQGTGKARGGNSK